jgi:hypothetical protein
VIDSLGAVNNLAGGLTGSGGGFLKYRCRDELCVESPSVPIVGSKPLVTLRLVSVGTRALFTESPTWRPGSRTSPPASPSLRE